MEDGRQKRKYLGIYFECCNAYGRIYVNKDNTAYEGRCPKCLRKTRARIGEGGSNQRFFRAQ